MANGIHPNYNINKHELNHKPIINNGLVLKYNSNQKYSSNMLSSFHLLKLANKLNIKLQKYCVTNSHKFKREKGSATIGPIIAANSSLRTIDIGIPQLSMHSIREVCGCKDICDTVKLLSEYYNDFNELDQLLIAD